MFQQLEAVAVVMQVGIPILAFGRTLRSTNSGILYLRVELSSRVFLPLSPGLPHLSGFSDQQPFEPNAGRTSQNTEIKGNIQQET